MPIKNSIGAGGFAISGGGGAGDMLKSTYDPGLTGRWQIANGGTGATTAADARTNLSAQAADADLDSLTGLSTGLLAHTTTNTSASRTLTGSSYIAVTNGDGVSGNPTIDFQNVLLTAGTQTVSGLKTFSNASGIKTDAIAERTSAAGVTVDGVLCKDGYYILDEQGSEPTTPASGKIITYAKASGSIGNLFTKNDAGDISVAGYDQRAIYTINQARNMWMLMPGANDISGSFLSNNGTTLQNSGSGSTTTAAVNAGKYALITTGTTSANYRGYYGNYDVTIFGALPIANFFFAGNGSTNVRYLACLKTGTGSPWGVDTLTQESIGFQFSTNRSDTELMAFANNGSTQTTTSTGVAIASWDTVTEGIWCLIKTTSTSSVSFYVFNTSGTQLGSTVTITTNLPASATQLRPFFGCQTLTTAAASCAFFGGIGYNQGYKMTSYP